MRRFALVVLSVLSLAVVGNAGAHPDEGELYIPWVDQVSGNRVLRSFLGDGAEFSTNAAPSATGAAGMTLVGNSDKDGTVNSDLAFWGNLAYAGNYDGFRILDISGAQPQVVVDHKCRGPAERRLGLRDRRQALPLPVDRQRPDRGGLHERGHARRSTARRARGLRGRSRVRRDRSREPAVRRHDPDGLRFAHAHDGARGKRRVTSTSRPIRWAAASRPPTRLGRLPRCEAPHSKISIIEVSATRRKSVRLREEPLSADTTSNRRLPGVPRHPGLHAEEHRGGVLRR